MRRFPSAAAIFSYLSACLLMSMRLHLEREFLQNSPPVISAIGKGSNVS